MAGILAFGGYIPALRLRRAAAFAATGWFSPSLKALAKGERSFCAWDEDTITMAVEAGRDCLADRDRAGIARVAMASTSHVFSDRLNSVVVKEALNLADQVATFDLGGSKRCATSMLIDAFHAVRGGAGDTLCLAAEKSVEKPGSEGEFNAGHAAAAILVSADPGCAELIGSHSVSVDFIDHFRKDGERFDYHWEARWVREEGYGKIVASAIVDTLVKLSLEPGQIDHFIIASPMRNIAEFVAGRAGIRMEAVADALGAEMGDAGAAQPLVLLARVLESARPGEIMLLAGVGSGCDVLVLRVTDAIDHVKPRSGVHEALRDRTPIDNYVQYLATAGLLKLDSGMRSEFDQKPILTAHYRDRKGVLGLVGGRCRETGEVQFPKTAIAVSRDMRAPYTLEDYPLAERSARLITFTSDFLTYTPAPPALYGMVEFDGGGRLVAEIRDTEASALKVGMALRMVFRIKAIDEQRGFSQYFWKAVPARSSNPDMRREQ